MKEAKPITVEVYNPADLHALGKIREVKTKGYELDYSEGRLFFTRVNEDNKYTKKAQACLVPILAGMGKDGKIEQSAISHLSMFMKNVPGLFRSQFREQLAEFRDLTLPKSRTAVVLAGHVPPRDHAEKGAFLKDYLTRLEMIRAEIYDVLKIGTTVLAGPTRTPGSSMDVYYNTPKRAAGIVLGMPDDVYHATPFPASQAQTVSRDW